MVKCKAGRDVHIYLQRMIDDKLMYGCGALACYQQECDDSEIRHNLFY